MKNSLKKLILYSFATICFVQEGWATNIDTYLDKIHSCSETMPFVKSVHKSLLQLNLSQKDVRNIIKTIEPIDRKKVQKRNRQFNGENLVYIDFITVIGKKNLQKKIYVKFSISEKNELVKLISFHKGVDNW